MSLRCFPQPVRPPPSRDTRLGARFRLPRDRIFRRLRRRDDAPRVSLTSRSSSALPRRGMSALGMAARAAFVPAAASRLAGKSAKKQRRAARQARTPRARRGLVVRAADDELARIAAMIDALKAENDAIAASLESATPAPVVVE
eukprot:28615-Pelagococcus_subviridis.AAC.1